MTDPLEQAAARPLPLIGDGCTRRYDPASLGSDHGTDFPGAEALWKLRQFDSEMRSDEAEALPTSD